MDPEYRLWFLERAMHAYLSSSGDRDDMAIVDLCDGHQYTWLALRASRVDIEVGSREHFSNRPLDDSAILSLSRLGFRRSRVSRDFVREGLLANPIYLSRLIDRVFECAYFPEASHAVRVSFRNPSSAAKLREAVIAMRRGVVAPAKQ